MCHAEPARSRTQYARAHPRRASRGWLGRASAVAQCADKEVLAQSKRTNAALAKQAERLERELSEALTRYSYGPI